MNYRNKHLLEQMGGTFDKLDYNIFKNYLRLPRPYLRLLFKRYKSFRGINDTFPRLIEAYHQHLWSKVTPMDLLHKKYMYAAVPPTMLEKKTAIAKNNTDQENFRYVLQNVSKYVRSGKFLYLYSDFGENALVAGTELVKAAIAAGESAYCVNFGWLLESFKGSNFDITIPELTRTRGSDLVMLYGVGTEYKTEYSNERLFSILEQRRLDKKATIIVSFLTPAEFDERYRKDINSINVGFIDTKIKQTLADLKKELEG